MRAPLPLVVATGFALAATAAAAQPADTSRYTAVDLKPPACREDPGPAEGFRCAGPGGWSLLLGFPAVGMSVVAAGAKPDAAGLLPRDGRSLAIEGLGASLPPAEWRGTMRAGRFEPYAAILRVSVLDATQAREQIEAGRPPSKPLRTQVLVVFRLGPEGTCQVAYIETQADANGLARSAADTIARTDRCPVAQVAVIGRRSATLDGNIR